MVLTRLGTHQPSPPFRSTTRRCYPHVFRGVTGELEITLCFPSVKTMQKRSRFTRRKFLKAAGVGIAAVSTDSWGRFAIASSRSPNEKLNIAIIGTANRASDNIGGVSGENLAAICDIDKSYLDRLGAMYPKARRYADYRELIAKEAGKIDAVVVSTADHHHAPATMHAIRSNLHVYCEKPLAHTVQEARLIAQAAKEKGLATQMGTQIHSGDNYRRVVEIVQSGAIGDITDVHVWVGKGWGSTGRPKGDDKPPESLSWNLWLGPAPVRPFVSGAYHPAQWRRYWDFGNGTLGDMGCHLMDLPFWALQLRHPTQCEAEGPAVDPEACPLGLIVRYDFPKRGGLAPVKLTWYDGNKVPKTVAGERVPGIGVMFIGSKGKLFADFKPPKQTIPKSIGHYVEWIKACKDGSLTTCNFDYSGALSEAVLLGNVAFRAGKKLDWDGEHLRATNCPEADKYIKKSYRAGWEVV